MSPGRISLAAAALLAVAACLPRMPGDRYVTGTARLVPHGGALEVAEPASPAPERTVELQYLGVGGWRIQTPHTVLLTGPLLTRPSMVEVGLGTVLVPDTAAILEALTAWDVGPLESAAAILVGHGHYDHLLDVPWVAARLAPRARILTNETSRLQLLALAEDLGLDPARVEDVTGGAASPTGPGAWIRLSRDVRVLPVEGDHAPHFAGHTLYTGVRRVEPPDPPWPATGWLDGRTLAFLVDILEEDGSVALRIYYHDGIPREPAGTLPREVLDEAPVDLALLVPASFAEVRWHPESLVENLRPRSVLVQHWESFFHPALDPAEPVAFTVLPDFMERVERVMPCGAACVHVPVPGARFLHPLGETPGAAGVPRQPDPSIPQ